MFNITQVNQNVNEFGAVQQLTRDQLKAIKRSEKLRSLAPAINMYYRNLFIGTGKE